MIPKRKSIRLKDYDYSQNGAYFITICTSNRKPLLSKIVGGGFHAAPQAELSPIGLEIERAIEYINLHHENALIEKYVIMPNHIHMIVLLNCEMYSGGHTPRAHGGNPPLLNSEISSGGHGNPPLHAVIGQLKSYTTKQFNIICNTRYQMLWQRSYHDHIIRDEQDYQQIWRYIDENPLKWQQDCYYVN